MWWLASFLCLVSCVASQELFNNADMESTDKWTCRGAVCSVTDTAHSGNHAIKVAGVSGGLWMRGVSQRVQITPGKSYVVSVWIKPLNDIPGSFGSAARLTVIQMYEGNKRRTVHLCYNRKFNTSDGWVHLRGDFTSPDGTLLWTEVFVNGRNKDVDYIIDDASMQELPEWTTWKEDTDKVIDSLRKSDISISVTTGNDVNKDDVQITISQTKKSFPFGTSISCREYYRGDKRYQKFINDHFNWATTENALKWNLMEKRKGRPKYWKSFPAIKKLNENGIKVRGHNILWSTVCPSWVQPLYGEELKKAVDHRITDIVSKTKDMLEHWDVNNENLHGFFYEVHANDSDYNLKIFKKAHDTAPNVKMFLNDYAMLSRGESTQPYLDQARKFKAADVGLYGIGVQGHFRGGSIPRPEIIKDRLDTLAKANVPIWISELSIENADENKRAEMFDTIFRLLYGHPGIEGIIMWGFWSERHFQRDLASLVSGRDFRINAAGQKVLDLLENEWMTNETHTLSQSGDEFTVRGFHGDYEVRVSYQGQELADQKKTFTLGKAPEQISLTIP